MKLLTGVEPRGATKVGRTTGLRQVVIPVVVILVIAMMLALLLLRSTFGMDVYLPLIFVLGGLLIALTLHEWRRAGHPLTPVGVLALGGILLFVLRPLTVASTGVTTAGAIADSRKFDGDLADAGTMALVQVTLFYVALAAAYVHSSSSRDEYPRRPAPARIPATAQARRAAYFLVMAMLVALVTSLLLIQSSGGLADHIGGVSLRSQFLGGRYFLTLGYVPLGVALSLYIITRRNASRRPTWNVLALAGAAVLLFAAFMTGGRGPLLLGAIVPLLVLKQIGPRPFRTPALIVIGVALAVGAMIMSLLLRENVYTEGAALAVLNANPVGALLERLTSGAETRPFDSLIVLNDAYLNGKLEWQFGATYLTVPTWFLPGSIAPWKNGGANTWFTIEYLPRFYYPDHIETSISAIGEAFANFGWVGVPLAGATIGLFAAHVTGRENKRATVFNSLLCVQLTPLFFSLVRGDSYQNVSLILLTAVIAAAMVKVAQDASSVERKRAHLRGG